MNRPIPPFDPNEVVPHRVPFHSEVTILTDKRGRLLSVALSEWLETLLAAYEEADEDEEEASRD